jgi:hypothetical protein
VRIFKNKPFARFARKARLAYGELRKAVEAIGRGLVDADLGGGVIKQRIARAGSGKSGSFRTIILLKAGQLAFFVRGFAKNELEISATMSWPRSRCSRRRCWLTTMRPLLWRWPKEF